MEGDDRASCTLFVDGDSIVATITAQNEEYVLEVCFFITLIWYCCDLNVTECLKSC